MRQPILTLLLILLAFVTGYEIRRGQTENAWDGKGGTAEYLRGQSNGSQKAGTSRAASGSEQPAPGIPSIDERIHTQAQRVADLRSQMEEKRRALAEVSAKVAEHTGATAAEDRAPLEAEINRIQGTLLALIAERDHRSQESLQSEILGETQSGEFKAEREQELAQFKSQLNQEQAIATELSRKLRELQKVNIDTPELREVLSKVSLQKTRVNKFQEQFQAYQREVIAANARDRVMLEQSKKGQMAGASASGAAGSLDQQIRVAQDRLKELQQSLVNLRQQESQKEAERELLNENYLRQRQDLESLVDRYNFESEVLTDLRARS